MMRLNNDLLKAMKSIRLGLQQFGNHFTPCFGTHFLLNVIIFMA